MIQPVECKWCKKPVRPYVGDICIDASGVAHCPESPTCHHEIPPADNSEQKALLEKWLTKNEYLLWQECEPGLYSIGGTVIREILDKLASLKQDHAKLIELLEVSQTLMGILTIRQVMEAGSEAIEAAGLNPWCVNEGQTTGDDHVDLWKISAAIDEAKKFHAQA